MKYDELCDNINNLFKKDSLDSEKLDQTKYAYVYNIVETLSTQAGIPIPGLRYLSTQKPRATSSGMRAPGFIVVTQGALDFYTPYELHGILAHEIGHLVAQDSKRQSLLRKPLPGNDLRDFYHQNEYAADKFSTELLHAPKPLIAALEKFKDFSKINDINHPSAEDRIARLKTPVL